MDIGPASTLDAHLLRVIQTAALVSVRLEAPVHWALEWLPLFKFSWGSWWGSRRLWTRQRSKGSHNAVLVRTLVCLFLRVLENKSRCLGEGPKRLVVGQDFEGRVS